MRIISGTYKGRRISPPTNLRARPTTDFAREGLFNLLENIFHMEGKRVLDLFAGTGMIGFECISRGAKEVVAVDIDEKALKFMKDTSNQLGLTNYRVIRSDALRYCQKSVPFDLIFADPPYGHKHTKHIPEAVVSNQLVTPGGCLIIEHDDGLDWSEWDNFTETRTYGRVNFSFFQF